MLFRPLPFGAGNMVEIRKEWRGLSKEDLLKKVYALGLSYEKHSYSCSQCTVAALYRILEIPEVLVKCASSNAGGTAMQLVGTCGGLVGGIMVLDYFFGRPFEHMSDKELIQEPNIADLSRAQRVARLLVERYIEEYGSITCADIQLRRFGRLFYIEDPEEFRKFEEAGGHSNDTKCPQVVGNAASWTLEILLKNA